jgi:chromosome segregation ATPase
VNRLSEQLGEARTAVAAADARAEAADHRAARAEEARRVAAEHAVSTEASVGRLQDELATTQAEVASATVRAESAERALVNARAELQTERDRNDARLSQLHEQVTQLVARKPPRRPAAKRTSPEKKPAPVR